MTEQFQAYKNKSLLGYVIVVVLVGSSMEVVFGLISDSTSLISDAIHMATDSLAHFIMFGASLLVLFSRWLKHNEEMTPIPDEESKEKETSRLYRTINRSKLLVSFLHKLNHELTVIVAHMLNGGLLILSGIGVCGTGIIGFWHYDNLILNARTMLPAAIFGLVINLVNLILLARSEGDDLNSVIQHVKGDLFHSLFVIIAAVTVLLFGQESRFVDPLLSLVLAHKMVRWGWDVLREQCEKLVEMKPIQVGGYILLRSKS